VWGTEIIVSVVLRRIWRKNCETEEKQDLRVPMEFLAIAAPSPLLYSRSLPVDEKPLI
jgi:hypothetical protein